MKILLVAGKLSYSNRATYTLELVRGLVHREHQVCVAHHGGPLWERMEELGAEVFPVKFNYFSFRRLLGFLREFTPDLIHATGGARALATAVRLGKSMGVPVLHTVHSWLEEDQNEELPNSLRGIIAVNESLRQHLVNERLVPKGRIRVIPYGVDGAAVVPRDFGRRNEMAAVGTFGRLDRGRRYDEFLHAARAVRDRTDNVHFVIAGDGPDEKRLRDLARELKIADAVTFVQPQNDPAAIYTALDLLVIVSDWGGVGLTLLEGMAHGLPVIATGGGEVFSLLGEENVCGLVPQGDAERLADEIVHLVNDPDLGRRLGENARDHVLRHFPIEEQVSRSLDYYNDVLTQSAV
ncbi:MAG: glycosyltransferase family 4 protein [Planctomycetota bacterium]